MWLGSRYSTVLVRYTRVALYKQIIMFGQQRCQTQYQSCHNTVRVGQTTADCWRTMVNKLRRTTFRRTKPRRPLLNILIHQHRALLQEVRGWSSTRVQKYTSLFAIHKRKHIIYTLWTLSFPPSTNTSTRTRVRKLRYWTMCTLYMNTRSICKPLLLIHTVICRYLEGLKLSLFDF